MAGKFALGGLAGAGVYSVAPDYVHKTVTSIISHSSTAVRDRDVDALYKMVEQLSRDVNRRPAGVTVVHGSSGGYSILFYTSAAAGAGLLYLRFVKGWTLQDLMYVTRASLKNSINQVTSGLEGLSSRLVNIKNLLQQQIESLSSKQDEAMATQQEIIGQLNDVGRDVEGTRGEVGMVREAVDDIQGHLDEIAQQTAYTNQGIYLLCSVIGEIVQTSGQRIGSVRQLQQYVQQSPPATRLQNIQGLEALLATAEDDPLPGLRQRTQSDSSALRMMSGSTSSDVSPGRGANRARVGRSSSMANGGLVISGGM